MDADIEKYLRNMRDTEMPAMGNALGLLGPDASSRSTTTLVPEFDRAVQDDDRAAEGILGSHGQAEGAPRRPALAKEYMDDDATRCSRRSTSCRGRSPPPSTTRTPTIDQLLAIKQIAWLLRNTAGEASLIVSNGLGAGKVDAGDARRPTPNSSAAPRPPGTRWN